MRTIEEIKETICADFMRNESVAELFGFTPGDSFTSHFSKVSVIGILFYIFAVAAWALEKLFDTYKGEVDTRIEEIIPHRPRWYRDKVLAFMKGKTLIADTDRYDTEGMTEDAHRGGAGWSSTPVAGREPGRFAPDDQGRGREGRQAVQARRRDRGAACGLHRPRSRTRACARRW